MNGIWRFLRANAYLVVGLSFVVALMASASHFSSLTASQVEYAVGNQERIRSLLRANLLLQRSVALSSTGLFLRDSKPYEKGLGVADVALEHLQDHRVADFEKQRQFIGSLQSVVNGLNEIRGATRSAPISKSRFEDLSQRIENLGVDLSDEEVSQWKELVQRNHEIRKSTAKAALAFKAMCALLGLFLASLSWTSWRKRVAEKRLLESQDVIEKQRVQMLSAAKMSALGEMAGGVAHEINNPMSIIHLRAAQLHELVEEGELDRETLMEFIGTIENTALRVGKIVKGMRTFARDGAHDPFEAVHLKRIIDETLELCAERFKVHSVDLVTEDVPESLVIDCRATEISQVLLNLLGNAHDAIEKQRERWVRLSVHDLGACVEIWVTDSGSGIPDPKVREKIFQPFFTTKGVGKGTGLGLSISIGIVQSHNGNLRIDDSCPNTRFVVTLPKQQTMKSPTISKQAA